MRTHTTQHDAAPAGALLLDQDANNIASDGELLFFLRWLNRLGHVHEAETKAGERRREHPSRQVLRARVDNFLVGRTKTGRLVG